MYSLSTLSDLNKKEIAKYVDNKPPVRLTTIDEVKNAPDWSGLDDKEIAKYSGLKVVETYFVDSSGLGQGGEPALTYPELIQKLSVLKKSNKKPLYAVLSGVGQFQVYVTILK